MHNRNELSAFATGVIFGLVASVLLNLLPGSYRSLAATAIAECEKTLPRNQHCAVTAIPHEERK